LHIPARTDPCWSNPLWRTRTIRALVDAGLGRAELSEISGASMNSVKFWLSEHRDVIPANTLRLVMLELARRVA
jgi:hypothetical protein